MERTRSICPICLRSVEARRVRETDGSVYLEKDCREHGHFRTLIWKGYIDEADWRGSVPAIGSDTEDACGHCTGLCSSHERGTCCTLLEVTERCNMQCRFCFAEPDHSTDPSEEKLCEDIQELTVPGKTYLQLSGGEPTLRDDLPSIVAFSKKTGCQYVQLNSNGIRLAEDKAYVKRLAESGLDFVFLQFDGVSDEVHRSLRGRPMMEIKERAISNLGGAGIGVTLVPVIVPGVNDGQIGEILRYAIAHAPIVRGVHFQPVSYFGRLPHIPEDRDRYTLDMLIRSIELQTQGAVPSHHLLPSRCDHPMCGFHGDFLVLPDGSLYPLSGTREKRMSSGSVCEMQKESGEQLADQNRRFIGDRWRRNRSAESEQLNSIKNKEMSFDLTDLDMFLQRLRSHRFTVTAMTFQDAGNYDYERLRRCSLHVSRNGRRIPFCAAYLSSWDRR